MVPAKQTVTRQMWLTQIVPVGLCMALSMQLGNYAYLELTVAFIQMLKALCPVMTLIALSIARMLNPTKWLICSVLVMTLGVMVSSYGEVNFSWLGAKTPSPPPSPASPPPPLQSRKAPIKLHCLMRCVPMLWQGWAPCLDRREPRPRGSS